MHTVGRRSTKSSSHSCNLAKQGSVGDDEEYERMQRRMHGRPPDRAMGRNTSEAYQLQAIFEHRTVNACNSNKQLCGQASQEIRVGLADGGCVDVENVYFRRCIDDRVPLVCLVKTKRKRWRKSRIEAIAHGKY